MQSHDRGAVSFIFTALQGIAAGMWIWDRFPKLGTRVNSPTPKLLIGLMVGCVLTAVAGLWFVFHRPEAKVARTGTQATTTSPSSESQPSKTNGDAAKKEQVQSKQQGDIGKTYRLSHTKAEASEVAGIILNDFKKSNPTATLQDQVTFVNSELSSRGFRQRLIIRQVPGNPAMVISPGSDGNTFNGLTVCADPGVTGLSLGGSQNTFNDAKIRTDCGTENNPGPGARP